MEGMTALVSGGARGLGRAITEKLLERGAKVSIVDINGTIGIQTEAELQKKYAPDRVIFHKCDVTATSQLEAVFKKTIKSFGHLDIVCNNAAIWNEGKRKEMLSLNLDSVIESTMLGVEYMAPPKGHGGVVINIASVAGLIAYPFGPVYSATKSGVVAFTRSYGISSKKKKVRVNCICPTFIDTELMNLDGRGVVGSSQRLLDISAKMGLMPPTEVAEAVIALAADDVISGGVMLVSPGQREVITMPNTVEEILKASAKL